MDQVCHRVVEICEGRNQTAPSSDSEELINREYRVDYHPSAMHKVITRRKTHLQQSFRRSPSFPSSPRAACTLKLTENSVTVLPHASVTGTNGDELSTNSSLSFGRDDIMVAKDCDRARSGGPKPLRSLCRSADSVMKVSECRGSILD